MKARLSTALSFVAIAAIQFGWIRHFINNGFSLIGLEAPAFDLGILFPAGLLFAFYRLTNPGRFRRGGMVGGLAWFISFYVVGRYRADWVRLCLNPPVKLVASLVEKSWHDTTTIVITVSIIYSAVFTAIVLGSGYVATLLPSRKHRGLAETPDRHHQ